PVIPGRTRQLHDPLLPEQARQRLVRVGECQREEGSSTGMERMKELVARHHLHAIVSANESIWRVGFALKDVQFTSPLLNAHGRVAPRFAARWVDALEKNGSITNAFALLVDQRNIGVAPHLSLLKDFAGLSIGWYFEGGDRRNVTIPCNPAANRACRG